MHASRPSLGEFDRRVPHQRAVAEQPDIRARFVACQHGVEVGLDFGIGQQRRAPRHARAGLGEQRAVAQSFARDGDRIYSRRIDARWFNKIARHYSAACCASATSRAASAPRILAMSS
jgi:hypothetical protein